jgi:hypothetical protein
MTMLHPIKVTTAKLNGVGALYLAKRFWRPVFISLMILAQEYCHTDGGSLNWRPVSSAPNTSTRQHSGTQSKSILRFVSQGYVYGVGMPCNYTNVYFQTGITFGSQIQFGSCGVGFIRLKYSGKVDVPPTLTLKSPLICPQE